MTMRLHDERWWKHGRSQRLCGHAMHLWALKPSHTKLKEFEHWPHSPLNVQRRWIMALVVGFLIGWRSMTFQDSFDKYSIYGNREWRQWDYMMNVDENMDDLKHYVSMTCILETWNLPTPWRHVSYLTMSNLTHTSTSWRNLNIGPIHHSTCNIGG